MMKKTVSFTDRDGALQIIVCRNQREVVKAKEQAARYGARCTVKLIKGGNNNGNSSRHETYRRRMPSVR